MTDALVIGAGPAGLMAADVIASAGHRVLVADQMPSFGRKFLMAGKSGLNLTKADPLEGFITTFGPVPDSFRAAVRAFGPDAVQDWALGLGQDVFTGSTGRVFPKVMKASPLLRAWLGRLDGLGVRFERRWRWDGWEGAALAFETATGRQTVTPKVTILALGGKSWARLGSDGAWACVLDDLAPFKPANCGFAIDWSRYMAPFFGTPVKATALRSGKAQSRGEWVITTDGIEGGGIYEIAAAIRDTGAVEIDLIPDVPLETIVARINQRKKKASRQTILRQVARLPPVKEALFNEFAKSVTPGQPEDFARALKALPVMGLQPLAMDGAISTAGGLRFGALTGDWMLRDRPGVFAAGEMLDWEAPTGGYLITGCLATGRAAGRGATAYLKTT